MHLHWHRRDLRGEDNRGLASHANGEHEVVPVFVFDPVVLAHGSPIRVASLLEALAGLRAFYRDRGSDLVVGRGDPGDVLLDLAEEYGVESVGWNDDYSGLAGERDRATIAALEDAGVGWEAHEDRLLFEPGSITPNSGRHYSVFSYFWKKWRDREKDPPLDPVPAGALAEVSGDPLPTLTDLGFEAPTAAVPDLSPEGARARLEGFCSEDIYRYALERDYPAADATSHLSVDFKWGTLGSRRVYRETERALERAEGDEERESVTAFQRQLAWREFYAHVLAFNPEVVTEDFSGFERAIDWREDPDELAAWQAGETGYPIVDAGMRQLATEGWVHNRVRMIVASFLTKDLLIDWREGYDWYREHLLDHDTANDTGGWQWAASTGTDAQPYFRIFNPTTQGERYDPDAEYIRRYVPELEDVDAEAIHGWPTLSDEERERLAPAYPAPIVDHAARREAALELYERARGE
ncbi:cryptochrome/photolyase family protein [Natronobiforma cellulositropha]|uniref:cryptochrome/photolyase family protein n=1 Tax=Natronobiforma cellulositropha TaxID=1679076 RepID=UPI0021D5ADFD|nr:deoxyribodipyrimidine photo-lyase [Natronobiforma cellulositropha]